MVKTDDTTLCATILVLFLEFHPSQRGWNFLYKQTAEGNIMKKKFMSFAFEKIPHISLSCKLHVIIVEYWEKENGLTVINVYSWSHS